MDIIGFIATVVALVTNPFGFVDAAKNAARMGADLADEAQFRFREWLGRVLARRLRNFMWTCSVGIVLIAALVTVLQFSVLTDVEQQKGIFTAFIGVSLVSAVGVALFAWRQGSFVIGRPVIAQDIVDHTDVVDDQPLRVSFYWSGGALTLALLAVSVTLSFHALFTESRALWLVSMMTRYLGLVVIAVVLGVLSWVVKKGIGLLETVLQIVIEPVAALAPGITLKNVTARLFPNGLDIIDQQYWATQIALATSVTAVVCLPFDLLVYLNPTTTMATVVGGAYVFSLASAYPLRAVGLADTVNRSRDRLLTILFTWGKWVMLVILLPSGMFLSSELSNGLKARGLIASGWFADVLQGRQALIEHPSYWSILWLLVTLIVLAGMISWARGSSSSRMWKTIGVGVPALTCLYFAFDLNLRIKGASSWTPFSPNVAMSENQEIGIYDLAPAEISDTHVLLTWITDDEAQCRVEIKEIRNAKGETVDWNSGVKTDDKGRTFLEAVAIAGVRDWHKASINNLAPGWTVVYRIWTKHVSGPDAGMWPEQEPSWHNVTAGSHLTPAPTATSVASATPTPAPPAPSVASATPSAPSKSRTVAVTTSPETPKQKLAAMRSALRDLD